MRYPSLPPGLRLGIDLGGTKMEAALLECAADGGVRVVDRRRVPTPREGYESILEGTAQLIERSAADAGVPLERLPVGVGMPGGVRRVDGCVKNSNTTSLNGRPFRGDLMRRLGRELPFDNDANCFALAEAWMGAARGHREGIVFGVILGTGVGGGVVLGGRVWGGLQGIAGEWGHSEVYAMPSGAHGGELRPCYCGRRGCLETYASGPSVERAYEQMTGKALGLAEIARLRGEDEAAARCVGQLLEAFGRALATVINVLDPSVVVLGGGVSNVDALYTEGVAEVGRHVINDELLTPVVRNELGDSAGVFGAALLGVGA